MDNKYYGSSQTSSDFLVHYGIKGMKWGVRKALKKTGLKKEKALRQQYNKAQNRLAKLNKRADIGEQKKNQIKYAKRAGIGLSTSMLGTLGIGGTKILGKKYLSNIHKAHDTFYKGVDERVPKMIEALENNNSSAYNALQQQRSQAYQEYKNVTDKNFKNLSGAEKARKISALVDLGGLGYAGYAGTRSLIAKHRTTSKGHAKAVAKRDAWKKEMQSTFKGAQFDASGSVKKKKKRANI